MRGLARLAWTDIKLYLREPVAVFFTLAFAPMMVILFGAIYGNAPMKQLGGRGSMDVTMPGYTAMVLGTVGFLGVPIVISGYRESGVLRRFRATPLRPIVYIAADVASNLVMTLLGMVGLVAMGWLLYRVHFEGSVPAVIAAVAYSGLAMFAIGYLIGSLAPGPRTAQVIGMVIFYPMMFLSGAAIPLEVMPGMIRQVSDWLPLTYVVKLLKGLWFGDAWGSHLMETAVLAGVLILCAGLSARFFRWTAD